MSYALVRRQPGSGTIKTHGVPLSNSFAVGNPTKWAPQTGGTGTIHGVAVDLPNPSSETPVEVRLLLRHTHPDLDGRLVAKTMTTVGGTFEFTDLDAGLTFDVIARMEDRRDQIMSNVKPFDGALPLTITGSFDEWNVGQ